MMTEQEELEAIVREINRSAWTETAQTNYAAREILHLRKRVAELEREVEELCGDGYQRWKDAGLVP